MSLQRLVDAFSQTKNLPVEIPEVRQRIIEFGIQDEIIFVPVESDMRKCCGVYYQFTKHETVYATPTCVSLIVYCRNVDVNWQRVICAKEMIHIMDGQFGKTRNEADVQGLLDKLLGPLSTEDFGFADLMASLDKMAIYQSLAFLFPEAARHDALAALARQDKTPEEIAEWAALPRPLVDLALSNEWPGTVKNLISI